ncbi:MAG TPA: PAS domain S-box protein [Mucilaginibacter sp.]|nr:PAS domain S-box protein [Mucilaginibacter sp.]
MDSRLSFLFEHSNDLFCVFDINGNILKTNASFRHFTSYSEQELTGKNITDISHPDDGEKNIELLKIVASPKNIEGYLIRIKSHNGAFLNITLSLSFNQEDGMIYAVGIYADENLNIRNPHNISDKIQHVLANLAEGFFMLDKNWCIYAFNPAFQKIVNVPTDELHGADFRLLNNRVIVDEVIPEFENAFKNNVAGQIQYYDHNYKGWLRLNIYPYKGEVIAFIRDTTSIRVQQLILALEKNVLELHLLSSHSLSQVADELLMGIEAIFPEMYCSILEIDDVQEKVYHVSAPRLPLEYCMAINGLKIGPKAGSCGTAAYHREQVIVSDIENDPLWKDYKHFILPHGFKACWSTPVISSQSNKVLATFAIYYNTIREPVDDELQMIARTINILRVLIESKKSKERMAEQNKRLQDIASISSHNIRRPVATILGLVNLFDKKKLDSPLNKEIIEHLETTTMELDDVIHIIVEKTISI